MKYVKILMVTMLLLSISGCSANKAETNNNVTLYTQTENSNIKDSDMADTDVTKQQSDDLTNVSDQKTESNTEKSEKAMKLTLNAQEYNVTLNDNSTIDDILKLLPMTLEMQRYAGHEYYASLSETPTIEGVTKTSDIKAGGIYYWDGWNAFVINFEDINIAPYKVVHVGDINGNIVSELDKSGDTITVNVQ